MSNFIFKEISERLLERVSLLKITPQHILVHDNSQSIDLSSLKTLFPQAAITRTAALNQSYDLLIDNCSLNASHELGASLFNLKKLLNNNGLVIFVTLGRETFANYRALLKPNYKLIDMHNIGDLLLNLHFVDPVMEMEIIELSYKKATTLINDLQGADLLNPEASITDLIQPLATRIEIIYGHAWHQVGFHNQFTDQNNHTYIPIDSIAYMD